MTLLLRFKKRYNVLKEKDRYVDPEDHQRRNNARANYREELSRFGRMVSGLELEQQRHQAASERGSAEETKREDEDRWRAGGRAQLSRSSSE